MFFFSVRLHSSVSFFFILVLCFCTPSLRTQRLYFWWRYFHLFQNDSSFCFLYLLRVPLIPPQLSFNILPIPLARSAASFLLPCFFSPLLFLFFVVVVFSFWPRSQRFFVLLLIAVFRRRKKKEREKKRCSAVYLFCCRFSTRDTSLVFSTFMFILGAFWSNVVPLAASWALFASFIGVIFPVQER